VERHPAFHGLTVTEPVMLSAQCGMQKYGIVPVWLTWPASNITMNFWLFDNVPEFHNPFPAHPDPLVVVC
jgi:hypothetical protein